MNLSLTLVAALLAAAPVPRAQAQSFPPASHAQSGMVVVTPGASLVERRVDIQIDDLELTLTLERDSRLGAELRSGVLEAHAPGSAAHHWATSTRPQLFSGKIDGHPSSVVSATIHGGEVEALVHDLVSGESLAIEPDRDLMDVDALGVRHRILRATRPFSCGCSVGSSMDSGLAALGGSVAASMGGPTVRSLPVKFDTFPELIAGWNNDTALLLSEIESVVHHTSVLFEFQIGMRVEIDGSVCIRDGSCVAPGTYTPWDQIVGTLTPARECWQQWTTVPSNTFVYSHVFTPGNIIRPNGTAVGGAISRVINCTQVGGTWSTFSSALSIASRVNILAHELGHGLGLGHTSGLMNSQIDGFQLSAADQAQALQRLLILDPCMPLSGFAPPAPTVTAIDPPQWSSDPVGRPAFIDVYGTNLDSIYRVNCFGSLLDYNDIELVDVGHIRVRPPALPDIGTQTIEVIATGGDFSIPYDVVAPDAPRLQVLDAFPNIDQVYLQTFTDANVPVLNIYSLYPNTSQVLGSEVLLLRQPISGQLLTTSANGRIDEFWDPLGDGISLGTTVWIQSAVYDSAGVFHETSNIVPWTI